MARVIQFMHESVRRILISPMSKLVLLAEDNPADVLLCKRAVMKTGLDLDFCNAADGQTAAQWLSGEGKYAERTLYPFPALLITDLKMPMSDGFDLIRFVRTRAELKKMPIIVYTASELQPDVLKAAAFGATTYLAKSSDPRTLTECLRSILDPRLAAKMNRIVKP